MKPIDAEMGAEEAINVGELACILVSERNLLDGGTSEAYLNAAAALARLRVNVQRIMERLDGIADHGYEAEDMLDDLRSIARLSPASGEHASEKKEGA